MHDALHEAILFLSHFFKSQRQSPFSLYICCGITHCCQKLDTLKEISRTLRIVQRGARHWTHSDKKKKEAVLWELKKKEKSNISLIWILLRCLNSIHTLKPTQILV